MSKNKDKFLFASLPVCQFASLKYDRLTGLPANWLTIFILCSLCLFSTLYAQDEFIYDAQGRRNPFIPLVTPDGRLLKLEEDKDKENKLLLEGIIYDKYGRSYAIVNGEVVKIGDKIGDYQVLKIEEKRVIFIKEGEPLEIELKKEEP